MADDPLNPSGYLRGMRAMLGLTATSNLQRESDEPYDPAEDMPWTFTDETRLTDG